MEGTELALRDIVEELKVMNHRTTQLFEIAESLDEIRSLMNKGGHNLIGNFWIDPKTGHFVKESELPNINDIKIETPKDNLDNIK